MHENFLSKIKDNFKIERKAINAKMIKNSLTCGFKGFLNFNIGLIICITALATLPKDKKLAKERVKHGAYGLYSNIVPFLEVVVVMGIAMVITNKILLPCYVKLPLVMGLGMLIMSGICLTLRALGLREDCCGGLNIKESMKNDLFNFPNFNVPTNFYAKAPGNVNAKDIGQEIIDFIPKKILGLMYFVLGVVQLLEIPPRILIDLEERARKGSWDSFNETKNFIKLDIKNSFHMAYGCLPLTRFKYSSVSSLGNTCCNK